MAVLLLFMMMLIVGAAPGIVALRQAKHAMATMHQIRTQVIMINDACTDATQTRSALTRAYSTAKDGASKAAVCSRICCRG